MRSIVTWSIVNLRAAPLPFIDSARRWTKKEGIDARNSSFGRRLWGRFDGSVEPSYEPWRIATATFGGGTTTYAYDKNGNLIQVWEGGASAPYTMGYDKENRLRFHERPDGLIATYSYDADGKKRCEMEYGGYNTIVWDGDEYVQDRYVANSTFLSQSVPTAMTHGQRYLTTIAYQNTGAIPWLDARGFYLQALNPANNTFWGASVINMQPGQVVPVGGVCTFTFTATAPSTPGTYTFQWGMLQGDVWGFGPHTTLTMVTVS